MKTSDKISRYCFLTLFVSFALGVNSNNLICKDPAPGKTIMTYFKFPRLLIPFISPGNNEPLKVKVLFTTAESGVVNFVQAQTHNRALKSDIEKQFSAMKLPQLKHEVVYSVILSFRYLDE
jgi:hypothetical protein